MTNFVAVHSLMANTTKIHAATCKNAGKRKGNVVEKLQAETMEAAVKEVRDNDVVAQVGRHSNQAKDGGQRILYVCEAERLPDLSPIPVENGVVEYEDKSGMPLEVQLEPGVFTTLTFRFARVF